jgi:hypothetical protein
VAAIQALAAGPIRDPGHRREHGCSRCPSPHGCRGRAICFRLPELALCGGAW